MKITILGKPGVRLVDDGNEILISTDRSENKRTHTNELVYSRRGFYGVGP
jgi:hypothetical protein